jgi:hypothetical protein
MRGRYKQANPIVTTHSQKERQRAFIKEYALIGWGIFNLAEPYRRTADDVVIIKNSSHSAFLIIRPAQDNVLEVRPYVDKCFYTKAIKLISFSTDYGLNPIRWRDPVNLQFLKNWRELIDPTQHEEALLLGFMALPHRDI